MREVIRQSGRSSGKTAAMMKMIGRLPAGSQVAIVGLGGVREIDVQGDAVIVDPLALPAPEASKTPAEASEAEQSFQETPGMFDAIHHLHPPTIDPPYTPESTP